MKKNLFKVIMVMALSLFVLGGCGSQAPNNNNETSDASSYNGVLEFDHSMELKYATKYSVDYYKGGYKMITVNTDKKFLVVPENMSVPASLESDVTVLQMPVDNIMLSSTPTASLINAMGKIENVTLTTTDKPSWYIDSVVKQFDDGKMKYIGSYTEPDYEMLVATQPKLSVFSSDIRTTNPDIAAKFDELGLTFFGDESTSEVNPLGRVEWVKLYGALFDCEDAANTLFDEQDKFAASLENADTGKSVTVVYIIKDVVYVRKGGDYMSKMIDMAGGNYMFADVDPDKTGTFKASFEEFYSLAKDSDYILYVWGMGEKPTTLEEFKNINELFSDFKAVQEGNVWCTTKNFYQSANALGYMIKDMNTMLSDETQSELTYMNKLK